MHEERWLVKSSGRILGPFTLEELIQHLRARTLSVIDEVRDPMTRWSFVREHAMLKDVVKQLREEDDSHPEATQTTYIGRTMTLSVTETTGQEGELTPNPTLNQQGRSRRTGDARPINATERTVKPVLGGGRSFGSLDDKRVQEKIAENRRATRRLIWAGALALALAAGWISYSQRRSRGIALDQARQSVQLAREQARYGQLSEALGFMTKAAQGMALTAEDQILYAQLLMQVDGKSLEALRLLGDLKSLQEPRLIREASLTKTIAYMKEQRWNEATLEINALLSSNPADEQALHNLALLQYERGHVATSWTTTTGILERGYKNSELILLRGLLALGWPEKSGQGLRVNQAAEDLRQDVENNFELQFEKNIVLMALRLASGKTDEVLRVMDNMWKADPFDSRNFQTDLGVDHRFLSWERLGPICERVYKAFPDHDSSRALQAICLFQRGDSAQALQRMDESRKRLSQSLLLASAQALLFIQVGRTAEAKTLTQLAPEETLGQLALGQICQSEKDWACADVAWKKVLAAVPNNPMALYGQAMVSKQRGNDLLAREQIRNAVMSAPHYRPFLEVRGDTNGL